MESAELTELPIRPPDVLYASRGAHLQVGVVVLVEVDLDHGGGFRSRAP